MIYDVNRKFGVGKRRHVPHITLVGPIATNDERRLILDFARICSKTKLMKIKGRGFGTFDTNRVIFVNIGASERLNEFRVNLVDTLRLYCRLQPHDKRKQKENFGYHSTLAMKLDQNEFNAIKSYIKNKPAPEFTQVVMRITLLKGGKILREYDFLQRKLFDRREALNRHITRRSKTLLKEFMQGRYDPNKRISSKEETINDPSAILPISKKKNASNTIKNPSLFKKMISFFTRK